jgi:hypothetical protein
MAIYRLFERSPFGPEEIEVLSRAYEQVLRDPELVDRTDPVTLLIATKIIEIAQTGVREASLIRASIMREFGPH